MPKLTLPELQRSIPTLEKPGVLIEWRKLRSRAAVQRNVGEIQAASVHQLTRPHGGMNPCQHAFPVPSYRWHRRHFGIGPAREV